MKWPSWPRNSLFATLLMIITSTFLNFSNNSHQNKRDILIILRSPITLTPHSQPSISKRIQSLPRFQFVQIKVKYLLYSFAYSFSLCHQNHWTLPTEPGRQQACLRQRIMYASILHIIIQDFKSTPEGHRSTCRPG